MKYMYRANKRVVIVFIGLLTAMVAPSIAKALGDKLEPAAIFLTWRQDPTRTMTIDWHTEPGDEAISVVYYRLEAEMEWQHASADPFAFPFSDRTIYRKELTGLEPGSTYQFRVGEFERIYSFRTMPRNIYTPLRFAAGGDTSHGEQFKKTNQAVMKYDLDFIVIGGDLAYANGMEENLDRWISWFDRIKEDLITTEGRVVPMIVGIGNHDVVNHHYGGSDVLLQEDWKDEDLITHEGRVVPIIVGIGNHDVVNHHYGGSDVLLQEDWKDDDLMERAGRGDIDEATDEVRLKKGPYFYRLFAFPGQPGYGVLDFSDYLSLIILDSSHSNKIPGKQTDWLDRALQERQKQAHLIPVYHKPAYPSHRVQSGGVRQQVWSEQVLKYWVPLFEKYKVRVAFENDDHTYKRTFPLRNDKIDPSGIVYIGDGSWGVGKREPKTPEEVWYLQQSAQENSAVIVTLHGPFLHFLMINDEGDIIDEYPQTPNFRGK